MNRAKKTLSFCKIDGIFTACQLGFASLWSRVDRLVYPNTESGSGKRVGIKMLVRTVIIILSFSIYMSINRTGHAADDFKYDSKDRRDPFVPLIGDAYVLSEAEDLDLSELILEGVIFDPEGVSYVLINNKTLEEGHVIGGFKVTRIFEDGVIVEKGESQHTLRIKVAEVEE